MDRANCGAAPTGAAAAEEELAMNASMRALDEWLVITAEEPLGRDHLIEARCLNLLTRLVVRPVEHPQLGDAGEIADLTMGAPES
jgi:hypothetical protein